MIAAMVRWAHSIHAFGSSIGGSSWPWQNGQSGQPRPESVARTTTPTMTSRIAVPSVSAASFWKRVNGSPGTPDAGARRNGDSGSTATRILARHRAVPAGSRSLHRRPPAASATLAVMTPRSSLAFVAALVLVVAACGPAQQASAPASAVAGACPTTPAPTGTPEGWDVGAQQPSVFPQIINPGWLHRLWPDPVDVLVPRRAERPGGRADQTVEVALFDLGADPATAGPDGARDLHLGDRADRRRLRLRCRLPDGRHVGRAVHDAVGDSPPEVIRVGFDVQPDAAVWRSATRRPPRTPRRSPTSVAT